MTLGSSVSNSGWPWLRLSRFGEYALQQGAYRFHNKAEFMKALRSEAPDISPDTVVYLREAVTAFYTDCLLSTCVMLSIAVESEFLRLLDVAKSSRTYGKHFSRIGDGLSIRKNLAIWGGDQADPHALAPIGHRRIRQHIQRDAVLHSDRAQRVRGSRRCGNPPSRDQVYVYLQLFIPCAEQLMRLRRELIEPDYPRPVRAS